VPYPVLLVRIVGPERVLNAPIVCSDANSDQVVEIAVREAFDIKVDRRTVEFRVLDADRMNLVLADCECSQRMMVLLVLASGLSVSSMRTKSVGQLGYRKDAFGMELLSFLLRHARQQAELILLYTLTATPGLELALAAAMPIQHKLGRRIADQECRDVLDPFSNLAGPADLLPFTRELEPAELNVERTR
jgi:hypothetical protein